MSETGNRILRRHYNKHGPLPCNFSVTEAFYHSSRGSTCSRGNMQQMVEVSVRYYSQNKLMRNGKKSGKMVLKQSW